MFYAGFQQAEPPTGRWPGADGWLIFSRFLAGSEEECRADEPDTICVAEPRSEGGFTSIRWPYRWIDEGSTHTLRVRGEAPEDDGSRWFALEVGAGISPTEFRRAGALRFPAGVGGSPVVTRSRTTFVEIWNGGGFDRIAPQQVGTFGVSLEGMSDMKSGGPADRATAAAVGATAACSDRGVYPYVSIGETDRRVQVQIGDGCGPCRPGRLWLERPGPESGL